MTTPLKDITSKTNVMSNASQQGKRVEDSAPIVSIPNEELETPEPTLADLILNHLSNNDEGVIAKALHLVHEELLASEAQTKEFFRLGGHLAVVWLIRKYPYHSGILECGIDVLSECLNDDSLAFEEEKTALVRLQVVEAVIAAMGNMPNLLILDENITTSGLRLLYYLSRDFKMGAEHIVRQLSVVPYLIAVMREFIGDANVIEYGILFLRSLSEFKEFKETLIEADTLSVVVDIFKGHPGHNDIRNDASETIAMLMSDTFHAAV